MPHALLLSPDDQAVSAITAVLEELSVTCERPLDGVSAAQKINSQSFDLVLVDCENLPAAKLIFDVCRRGKNGNNPVPIAIVDGRAGLPTAFRLGAELILTKPVAKDQARNTIRSAVGRVKKDVPPIESLAAQHSSTSATAAPEVRAHAAAASASSLLTSFDEPAPSFAAAASPAVTSTLSAKTAEPPATAPRTHASVAEVQDFAATSTLKRPSTVLSESHVLESTPAGAVIAKPKLPLSDDPVLAELERTELEESEQAESKEAESHQLTSQKAVPPTSELSKTSSATSSATGSATTHAPAAKPDSPIFSTYQQKRNRGPMIALFVLFLTTAGFYAAWTYQPGFQAIALSQLDHVLELAGLPRASAPAPAPVKPVSSQPVSTPATATTDASNPPASAQNSAATSAAASTTDASGTTAPTQPTATQAAAAAPSPATATSTAANSSSSSNSNSSSKTAPVTGPVAAKPDTGKPEIRPEAGKLTDVKSDGKKDLATALSETPLPGESTAIILSSKGAEKRLARSTPPKYPAGAHLDDAQGTVVLKEVVDENGKVAGVRLVEGNPALATAAINAVKQWRYRPYERDGKTQPFQTVVIIDFQRP